MSVSQFVLRNVYTTGVVYVISFRFADEVNGEIPEVDCRGRIRRFVCYIDLAIKSKF